MLWYQRFQDGPEYEARQKQPFAPSNLSLKDIHAVVPKSLFKKNTLISLLYIVRHLGLSISFYILAIRIDSWLWFLRENGYGALPRLVTWTVMWGSYWFWQSISLTGIWCLGHEAGHDALSPYPIVNALLGLVLHTSVLVPYYAWRITHRTHHKSTNNLERDETYIPPTRADFKLPDGKIAVKMDYKDVLEETPGFTLFKLVMRQFLGYQIYLMNNRKGNPKYPKGTSHYKPSSALFKPEDRQAIIISNISIGTMLFLLSIWIYNAGFSAVWKYYFVPWLFANNWIVMITYLQHSDPTIPYYRREEWTFARGALATVDRPFFGWIGRFFLHNLAHDHVAHHFFSTVPFYNLPAVTEAIKPVLGTQYNYDTTNIFYALWRSFRNCTFVEAEGDIVFFKNQRGEVMRAVQ
ncbi:hypothetical protein JAAARDRAFT_182511 [Jaapia argillacea MUCL 33604]|uniref:Fatty acid desaturase domain-containing protein n=1 Tax=Jaapia argillacea MUCL 33604 TaxID=933084 RepID=A0A067PS37_9AGAM|nr:hypothetical protein JAAARDRAFT_182511 [Jaapia argillacea MUCL 33604]